MSKHQPSVLVVIPARGGSKGIPRKNLRLLNGKPLIFYAIETALRSKYEPLVCVSSDDEEILSLAAKLGSDIHHREPTLADDACTLDPVIHDTYQAIARKKGCRFDLIVTLQPTSPLLRSDSLDRAITKMLAEPHIDTLISACEDTHLTWGKDGGFFVPNYEKRVNRQFLPPVYREAGAFLITRAAVIAPDTRIGNMVDLFLLKGGEAIDIDTYEDWSICEFILKRKTVLFVVSGYESIGMGHVYRCLLLAAGILNHQVVFLVDDESPLAYDKINQHHYEVYMQRKDDILDDIDALAPDVVINDILDTTENYVVALKRQGVTVINFEDLGEGALQADLVVNALYPEKTVLKNHYFGHNYFCARDEFIHSIAKQVRPEVERVLLTYGGVDPNNLTRTTLAAIYDYCQQQKISISVVLGMGYRQHDTLTPFTGVEIRQDVHNISEEMLQADIAFTSAGRTIYELACIGTPAIVLAQNVRELTHFFASEENGFINLGLGENVTEERILQMFKSLVKGFAERRRMNEVMLSRDLRSGRNRVHGLIQRIIESNR